MAKNSKHKSSRAPKVAENTSKQQDATDTQSGITLFILHPLNSRSQESAPKKRQVDALPVPKKLIYKPLGSAGRRNGYNLQDAMGLGDNRQKYNRLVVHICISNSDQELIFLIDSRSQHCTWDY